LANILEPSKALSLKAGDPLTCKDNAEDDSSQSQDNYQQEVTLDVTPSKTAREPL
jgi:hypothetical protein